MVQQSNVSTDRLDGSVNRPMLYWFYLILEFRKILMLLRAGRSAVCIATTLRAGSSGDQIPAEARFSGTRAHPASYIMGTGSLTRG